MTLDARVEAPACSVLSRFSPTSMRTRRAAYQGQFPLAPVLSWLRASSFPAAAAFSNHCLAAAQSLGAPSPRAISQPRLFCAGAYPWAAAICNQRTASVEFCDTPLPRWYRTPILFWAEADPWAAAI